MNYSRSDIEHMREDALRRTREMHSRARVTDNDVKKEPQADAHSGVQADEKAPEKRNDILSGLLPNVKIDGDKLLLILLIIILSNEGADLKLLIALGYILL